MAALVSWCSGETHLSRGGTATDGAVAGAGLIIIIRDGLIVIVVGVLRGSVGRVICAGGFHSPLQPSEISQICVRRPTRTHAVVTAFSAQSTNFHLSTSSAAMSSQAEGPCNLATRVLDRPYARTCASMGVHA
ncbi:hypothetical protein AAHC03_04746 [Spirometra sp. Aus1]